MNEFNTKDFANLSNDEICSHEGDTANLFKTNLMAKKADNESLTRSFLVL